MTPVHRALADTEKEETSWRHKMADEAFYAMLDPGIRFAVRLLHAHGIETSQSCEGGEGHSYDLPTVDLRGSAHDVPAFAALHYLDTCGLDVASVAQVWSVERGRIHEVLWRVELNKPCPERANEMPGFVWGYQAQASS